MLENLSYDLRRTGPGGEEDSAERGEEDSAERGEGWAERGEGWAERGEGWAERVLLDLQKECGLPHAEEHQSGYQAQHLLDPEDHVSDDQAQKPLLDPGSQAQKHLLDPGEHQSGSQAQHLLLDPGEHVSGYQPQHLVVSL